MPERLIVADENIPEVQTLFAPLGEVRARPGRSLARADLEGAEILLVRSVTTVDRSLLQGSPVRFVGSATIGTDHLDLDYLNEQRLVFANAPASNAVSVVEYVLSGLCALDGVLERLLNGGTVGIIGLGNVGARLLARLRRLGIHCIGYDPLLAPTPDLPLASLDKVLAADVVCCHTPLTRGGPYPTWHMLDRARLRQLRPGAVLLNAGRGGVIDNAALLAFARERADVRVVLDVWEGEPGIDMALLEQAAIGTPHIAGYSWDGKLAGTRMLLEACCRYLGRPLPSAARIAREQPAIVVDPALSGAVLLRSAMLAAYDVRSDSARMRQALRGDNPAAAFDALRKHYPVRRELAAFRVDNWMGLSDGARMQLRALGFRDGSGEAVGAV